MEVKENQLPDYIIEELQDLFFNRGSHFIVNDGDIIEFVVKNPELFKIKGE